MSNTSEILLRRRNAIKLKDITSKKLEDNIITALETQLADLGYVLSKNLRDKILYLKEEDVKELHDFLFKNIGNFMGFNRPHNPLFVNFPKDVPENTSELLIKRTIAYHLQDESQISVISGKIGKSHLLSCGHYVHDKDWDGSEYSNCPICGRIVNKNNEFFKKIEKNIRKKPISKKLKILRESKENEIKDIFNLIVNSSTPISFEDQDDLKIIIENNIDEVINWLPEKITLKENIGLIFGYLLKIHSDVDLIFEKSRNYLKTATDVLRVVSSYCDSDISLSSKLKLKNIPRKIRKNLFSILENIHINSLIEDMLRNESIWKKLGEYIHPFEYSKKYPKCSTAFAVIRNLKLSNDNLSRKIKTIIKSNKNDVYIDYNNKVKFETWYSKLEKFINLKEYDNLIDILSERPGELSRRIDQILRLVDNTNNQEKVINVIIDNLNNMNSTILLNLSSYLKSRTIKKESRIFFPKGDVSKSWFKDDDREPLSDEIVNPIIEEIDKELIKRSKNDLNISFIDEKLENLIVPFSERNVSKSLVRLPRGSKIPIPEDNKLRLFLHWMEDNEQRIDLDLSTAFFDSEWNNKGLCDYTHLNYINSSAVHSGDYTSAPKPDGATEFLDLDIEKLINHGVRYVSYIVFSFNSIPFDEMSTAFTGWMSLKEDQKLFEPKKVEQKFDLDGKSKIIIPMIIDLYTRTMYWVDMNHKSNSPYNSVSKFRNIISKIGKHLLNHFDSNQKPSLFKLGALHSSKSEIVYIRKENNEILKLEKNEKESDYNFYQRIILKEGEKIKFENIKKPIFSLTYKDDFKLSENSVSYSLYRENDTSKIEELEASELLNKLKLENYE